MGELFGSRRNKDHGAIYLSQKRCTDTHSIHPTKQTDILTLRPDTHNQEATPSADDESHPLADLQTDTPLPLLIRASNGKSKDKRSEKVKLSTLVEPDALDAFYARYAEVCKGGMAALKPRDRTKRKGKAKKKKFGGAGTTSMTAIP